jgi:hypothetical protein
MPRAASATATFTLARVPSCVNRARWVEADPAAVWLPRLYMPVRECSALFHPADRNLIFALRFLGQLFFDEL